jgi:hypothetical protein
MRSEVLRPMVVLLCDVSPFPFWVSSSHQNISPLFDSCIPSTPTSPQTYRVTSSPILMTPTTFHRFPKGDTVSELVPVEKNHLHDSHIRRLQNLRSPIYTLPTEVLSDIFLQVARSEGDLSYNRLLGDKDNLSQSVVLSPITTRFRRVALGTAGLWKRVPLLITEGSLDKAVTLF